MMLEPIELPGQGNIIFVRLIPIVASGCRSSIFIAI